MVGKRYILWYLDKFDCLNLRRTDYIIYHSLLWYNPYLSYRLKHYNVQKFRAIQRQMALWYFGENYALVWSNALQQNWANKEKSSIFRWLILVLNGNLSNCIQIYISHSFYLWLIISISYKPFDYKSIFYFRYMDR